MLSGLMRLLGYLYLRFALGKEYEKKNVSLLSMCFFTILIIMWLLCVLFCFTEKSLNNIIFSILGLAFFLSGRFFLKYFFSNRSNDDSADDSATEHCNSDMS